MNKIIRQNKNLLDQINNVEFKSFLKDAEKNDTYK